MIHRMCEGVVYSMCVRVQCVGSGIHGLSGSDHSRVGRATDSSMCSHHSRPLWSCDQPQSTRHGRLPAQLCFWWGEWGLLYSSIDHMHLCRIYASYKFCYNEFKEIILFAVIEGYLTFFLWMRRIETPLCVCKACCNEDLLRTIHFLWQCGQLVLTYVCMFVYSTGLSLMFVLARFWPRLPIMLSSKVSNLRFYWQCVQLCFSFL